MSGRITIEPKALEAALADHLASGKRTLAELTHVHLDAADGRLTVRSTDLDAWLSRAVPCEVSEPLQVAAEPSRLAALCKMGQPITLVYDGAQLVAKRGRSRAVVPSLPYSWPDLLGQSGDAGSDAPRVVNVDCAALAVGLRQLMPLAASNDVRFFLLAVNLADGYAEATSGRAMGRIKGLWPEDAPSALVPRHALPRVCSALETEGAQVSVGRYGYAVSAPDLELAGKLVDGRFPDLEAAGRLQPTPTHWVRVERKALLERLQGLRCFFEAPGGKKSAFFVCTLILDPTEPVAEHPNGLSEDLSGVVTEGEGRPAPLRGRGARVGLDLQMLCTVLAAMRAETIWVGLSGEDHGVVLEGGERDVSAVVMPCRL